MSVAARWKNLFRAEAVAAYRGGDNDVSLRDLPRPARRRMKVVLQESVTDCGAACVAMVLSAYGRLVSLDGVRAAIPQSRDGVDALSLLNGARQLGLHGRGFAVPLERFGELPLPAILHWDFRHFVVLERVRRNGDLVIVDPSRGRRTVPRAEAGRKATGVVLTFEPAGDFVAADERAPILRYLRPLRDARLAMGAVLACALILQLLGLVVPYLMKTTVDRFVPRGTMPGPGVLAAALAAFAAAYGATGLLRLLLLSRLQQRLDERMTSGFFAHLLTLPFSFFQQRASGDLLARLNSNTIVREIVSQSLLSMSTDTLFALGYFVLLWMGSPALALLAFGFAAALIAVSAATVRLTLADSERELSAHGRCQGYLVESLRGMETVKSLGVETRVFDRWRELNTLVLAARRTKDVKTALATSLLSTLTLTAPVALLLVACGAVIRHELTLGDLFALLTLAGAFLSPMSAIASRAQDLRTVGVHLRRLQDVFEAPPEERSSVERTHIEPSGRVELRGAGFRYDARAPLVLHDVDLRIDPGEFIGIVGPSGSGKSTLAKLLAGLVEPSEGTVCFDGVDVRRLNRQALRARFGIVIQGGILFSDSVAGNIRLGNPGATIDDIEEAARAAAIDGVIEQLPLGYDTPLSEAGSNLSGGQAQRICIARALAKKPSVVIFDEATSELDVETESRILQNLARQNATRIVIAHRLNTLALADRIVVLDNGGIVEMGTHAELVLSGGWYSRAFETASQAVERDSVGPIAAFA